MIHTILSMQAELLIPIFAVILSFSIPIIAIYFYYKHKASIMEERKLMIEKGMTPPELSLQLKNETERHSPMSKGINLLAVALGIISGYLVSVNWGTVTPISILCGILFWLGIANIVKSFLLNSNTNINE